MSHEAERERLVEMLLAKELDVPPEILKASKWRPNLGIRRNSSLNSQNDLDMFAEQFMSAITPKPPLGCVHCGNEGDDIAWWNSTAGPCCSAGCMAKEQAKRDRERTI